MDEIDQLIAIKEEIEIELPKTEQHCDFCWKDMIEDRKWWKEIDGNIIFCNKCMERVKRSIVTGGKIMFRPWRPHMYLVDIEKRQVPVEWIEQPITIKEEQAEKMEI